jgi:hypothetical protein
MSVFRRIVILLEALVGFALPIYIWLLGVIVSPLFVARLIADGELEAGMPLTALVAGGIGIWGMLQLAIKVMEPEANVAKAGRLRVYVAFGFAALVAAAFLIGFEPGWFGFIFLLPALVAAHFVFLARGYLWVSS